MRCDRCLKVLRQLTIFKYKPYGFGVSWQIVSSNMETPPVHYKVNMLTNGVLIMTQSCIYSGTTLISFSGVWWFTTMTGRPNKINMIFGWLWSIWRSGVEFVFVLLREIFDIADCESDINFEWGFHIVTLVISLTIHAQSFDSIYH